MSLKALNHNEIQTKLSNISDWNYESSKLVRHFEFKNFKEAFSFMTAVAFEAEAQNHHPEWNNVYNKVTIELITHDVPVEGGAVSDKDFELATLINKIANRY